MANSNTQIACSAQIILEQELSLLIFAIDEKFPVTDTPLRWGFIH
jgi:hypothetical protein